MLTATWSAVAEGVCSLTFLSGENRISSGTGFRVGDSILTNNHVLQVPGAETCVVRFVGKDGHSTTAQLQLSMDELRSLLRDGDPQDSWDYAVLALPENFRKVPSLTLARDDEYAIGESVALMGFHFEQANLAIHAGVLSSMYTRAGVDYLMVDASVNHGNSGGPLIRPSTGEVVGIVTRKATGLSAQFDNLIKLFEQNAAFVRKMPNLISMGTFRITDALADTQVQMRTLAQEIRRSANVGIGYAYRIHKVREALSFLS